MTPETVQAYRLTLPWSRPPLTGNDRDGHWAPRHRSAAEIRRSVAWLAKTARIPAADHLTVGLAWAPGDRRKRDSDNLWPTLKVSCDALARGRKDFTGLDLVVDDDPAHMTKLAPVIIPPPASPGMWLVVMLGRHSPQEFEEFLHGNAD